MASSERKRQDKLARKAAKRKQHQEALRRSENASSHSLSTAGQIALVSQHGDLDEILQAVRSDEDHGGGTLAADAPVHACLVPDRLFETGIGTVVMSRKLPTGDIAAAVFLLDVWCLGVKDAFLKVASPSRYPDLLRALSGDQRLKPIDPACARKLVEEAEAYAANLGFRPHPDYQRTRKIFGDIDATACRTQFRFGKDGKPLYVSGPRDTEAKSKKIVDTLMQRCGPGNFHYLVALGSEDDLDDWIGEEDDGESEVIEGELGEQNRALEEGQPSAPQSWLQRLRPFRH